MEDMNNNTTETASTAASAITAASERATENPAYTEAKELAESYGELLKQKESYRGRLGKYPHYTMDDVYYLLTQGAHEQTERVQTGGTSDPVSKAVMNAEKLLRRLNAEMDAEYQKEVVEPYMDICERVHLFEICMNSLGRKQYYIADQLYVQKLPRKEITDIQGKQIGRRRLAQETENILRRFAEVLEQYKENRSRNGGSEDNG